jgi:hypothetical protein
MMLWIAEGQLCMYFVRKLKLGVSDQLQLLSRAAGKLYSKTLVSFWRVVRKKGLWLKPATLMRWFPNDPENRLHAHSADAVVQSFFSSSEVLEGTPQNGSQRSPTSTPSVLLQGAVEVLSHHS